MPQEESRISAFNPLLLTPLERLKGVGPRLQSRLKNLGLETVYDLLFFMPFRYEDWRTVTPIARLKPGIRQLFKGEILHAAETRTRNNKRIYEVIVSDGTAKISLKWFHFRRAWMEKQYQSGRSAYFTGEVKGFAGHKEILHPDTEFITAKQKAPGGIFPIYPLTEGLPQKTMRKIIKDAVDKFSLFLKSPVPQQLSEKRLLLPISEAVRAVHIPSRDADFDALLKGQSQARRTLVYDEFFYLQLGLALKRKGEEITRGIAFKVDHSFTRPLIENLPFELTDAQKRVLTEIKSDLMKPSPMNRLLQGDVGSGKTIVALLTALIAIENKTQVAVVAPTEILAEQHFVFFKRWLDMLGLTTALLTGSQSTSEKKAILSSLETGDIDLIVGTHALLQETVVFKRLGLGIVDEQHRFGVKQRQVLHQKGENPHILVMTATPIPRTLALTAYGDLAVSIIDEMPAGRLPVSTHIIREHKREGMYRFLGERMEAGEQVFVVYPLVEESEKMDLQSATEEAEVLQEKLYPDKKIGLLHGRMKSDQKDEIMQAFKNREIDLLVSTTVIEVGIDIPDATVMVIEHAERFGLAQLHQLRGRVGRSNKKSYCFLLPSEVISAEGRQRLDVMCKTTDGFQLAEADLQIRGPGEFLGTRQSGIPDFHVADLLRDQKILEEARQDAFELSDNEDIVNNPEFADLKKELIRRWGGKLDLFHVA